MFDLITSECFDYLTCPNRPNRYIFITRRVFYPYRNESGIVCLPARRK